MRLCFELCCGGGGGGGRGRWVFVRWLEEMRQ